jgi:oligopeptide/dipeptide ABC transporter ATP-binding protein
MSAPTRATPDMRSTAVLEIQDLELAYQVGAGRIRAADGVTLTVADGEAVGIVGESGSGKSTIARAALGLLPPTAQIDGGRIVVGGCDVTRFTAKQWVGMRGHPVAIVFQDPLSFLNPVMRIGRQIEESVRRHDRAALDVDARVAELLELVKLPRGTRRAFAHELSGGMRQRAMLAIALGCRPRLLIADEPTTALDVTTQAEIMALLRALRERSGMALLLISHDLGVVASACDHIYVMYAGRMIEWGATRDIFAAPGHPYTAGLLQAAIAEKDARGRFKAIPGDLPNLAEPSPGCPFAPRCGLAAPQCLAAMPAPALVGPEQTVRCHAVAAMPAHTSQMVS